MLRRQVDSFQVLGEDQRRLLLAGGISPERIIMKRDVSPVVISGDERPAKRPDELGSNTMENILKDYNGLTCWMSINPYSFMRKESKFPKWLSVGLGYGAEGMTGGFENPTEVDGQPIPPSDRYRQYYLAIDFDYSCCLFVLVV